MQTIQCPNCQNAILIDVHLLLKGQKFVCPGCHAELSLALESKQLVENAINKLDDLMKQKQQNIQTTTE